MSHNQSLHFNFLLEEERVSSSPLRMKFILPVLGVLCLLAPLALWIQEAASLSAVASKKAVFEAGIANLKAHHEVFLKKSAEVKELTAELQQFAFYRASKNVVGETLAHLTNCVSSRIQLTKVELLTQTSAPFSGPQVRPKLALDLVKLCPTNQMESVTLRLSGRAVQAGGNPVEVNRFLQALQGKAFASLLDPSSKPKITFRDEAAAFSSRPGEGSPQEVVAFEIVYECLPRRFQ